MVEHTVEWIKSLDVKKLKRYIKLYKKVKIIAGMNKSELLKLALDYFTGGSEFIGCAKCRKNKCLDPECEHCGAGFFNQYFGKQKLDFNKTAKATLKRHGDSQIIAIKLFASLLSKFDKTISNIVMMGRLKEIREKYGVDELFHLGILFSMQDGSIVCYEKGETVLISDKHKDMGEKTVRYYDVPISHLHITLNEFVAKSQEHVKPEDYFIYSGLRNNCQKFIITSLERNGLMTNDIRKFGKQNTDDFVKELPAFSNWAMNKITGIIARQADEEDEINGGGFAEENAKRKAELNASKNVQSEGYKTILGERKAVQDKLYSDMISYLANHTEHDAEELRAMPHDTLVALMKDEQTIEKYEALGAIYKERFKKLLFNGKTFKLSDIKGLEAEAIIVEKDKIIKYRREMGFVYNDGKLFLDEKGYDVFDEEGMNEGCIKLYNKLDAEVSYAISLSEMAEKLGWHYDPDEKKWFMINTRLEQRQYIESGSEAYQMNGRAYADDERKLYERAFQVSHQMALEDAWWNSSKQIYEEYSEDMWTRINDFTGGILNKVVSFIPGANISLPLIQTVSKLMSGTKTKGDVGLFVKSMMAQGENIFNFAKGLRKGGSKSEKIDIRKIPVLKATSKRSGSGSYEEKMNYHKDRLIRNHIILNPKFLK